MTIDLVKEITRGLKPHDVLSLTIDREGQITVTLAVPLNREKGQWIEQDVQLSMDESPEYLRVAARSLVDSTIQAVKDIAENPPAVPCETCIAACCRHPFEITLTHSDLERIKDAPIKVRRHVRNRKHEGLFGEVAFIDKKRLKNPVTGETDEVCSLLHKDGYCSIYSWRPQVCRDFDPWSCGMKVESPNSKKLRLPVWQGTMNPTKESK